MSKITDNAFLFQKTFGTSGVNAIGSFQLSQLNSSSVQSQCPQWRDRKSTRLNSSHMPKSRMPSSA